MYDFTETFKLLNCPKCKTQFYCYAIFADDGGDLYLRSFAKTYDDKKEEGLGWWCASCPKCNYPIKVMKYETLK